MAGMAKTKRVWMIDPKLAAARGKECKAAIAADPKPMAKLIQQAATRGDRETVDRIVNLRAMWLATFATLPAPTPRPARRRVTVKG